MYYLRVSLAAPTGTAGAVSRRRRLFLPAVLLCACGCGEYSEVLTVSADGRAEASVEVFLPRIPPSPEPDGYIPKTAGGGAMPPDILNVAGGEIAKELATLGAVRRSLEESIEADGRKITGKFDLGCLLAHGPGAGRREDTADGGTGAGGATAPRREGRPAVTFEEEGAGGEDASETGSAGKLLVYRRAVPASYFQNLAQAALRHNLRYPVTRRFAWTFRLKLPGRPVPERTNGEIGPDGTVTWRFDLGDLMKDGADMRAACTAPRPAHLLPAVMPWLVAFLVFSGMVLAAGLYGLKRCLDRERDTGTPPDFEV